MTTYYRGSDVLVTSRVFVLFGRGILRRGAQRLPIDELHGVYVVRGEAHPARTISAHLVGAAAICVAASWTFLESPRSYLLALVVLTAPSVACVGCMRLTPRAHELRATYRVHDVRLYVTTDSVAFGRVRRALARALEERDTRGGDSLDDLYK